MLRRLETLDVVVVLLVPSGGEVDRSRVSDEVGRLAALAACAVLDTPRETPFDNIVFTTAQLFRAPMAALTLVSAERVWVKAAVGPIDREWSREGSFCHQVIQSGDVTVIEDALADARYATFQCVAGHPSIRFVAGAPLRGPGRHFIGALCALDRLPRSISDAQRTQLAQLAVQASELLCLRVPDLDLDMAG